jgi:hypothetical protein
LSVDRASPFEQHRVDLAIQLAGGPAVERALFDVEPAGEVVLDAEQADDVGPGQFRRRACEIGEDEVKRTEIQQVTLREASAVRLGQLGGQRPEQRLAILGALRAVLLELDDVPAELPVERDHLAADRRQAPAASGRDALGHGKDEGG